MTIWRLSWRLLRVMPGLYLLSFLLQLGRLAILTVPGLMISALFDTLSRHAHATWGVWALLALLVATTLPRVAILLGAVAVEYTCYFLGAALLRRNLLARLLARPGALAFPSATGETVNRLVGTSTRSWSTYASPFSSWGRARAPSSRSASCCARTPF
jgi:hypothetical protein